MDVTGEKFDQLSMTRLKTFAAIDIKKIPLKLLMLLDGFLGIGIVIAFFHCIATSSQCRTISNICRKFSVS